jgi:hypothetical protein
MNKMLVSKSMLRILILIFIAPLSWGACDMSKFNTQEIRALHNKFSEAPSSDNAVDLIMAMPDRFCEFNALYGYDKKAGPLYDVPLYNQFDKLEAYIDHKVLISKYVALASEAKWDADSVNYLQYSYRELFLKHPKETIDSILSLPKNKVRTAVNFLFDGPHPSRTMLKEPTRTKICNINSDFCEILGNVESTLLKKEHHH